MPRRKSNTSPNKYEKNYELGKIRTKAGVDAVKKWRKTAPKMDKYKRVYEEGKVRTKAEIDAVRKHKKKKGWK